MKERIYLIKLHLKLHHVWHIKRANGFWHFVIAGYTKTIGCPVLSRLGRSRSYIDGIQEVRRISVNNSEDMKDHCIISRHLVYLRYRLQTRCKLCNNCNNVTNRLQL